MREHKNFWDRNAGLYDCFMRKDRAAYEKMYELIHPVVKDKTVLEVATGTGLIAKHIVKSAAHIEATDASPEMIAEAKRGNYSAKLRFSVQDMFSLLLTSQPCCYPAEAPQTYRSSVPQSGFLQRPTRSNRVQQQLLTMILPRRAASKQENCKFSGKLSIADIISSYEIDCLEVLSSSNTELNSSSIPDKEMKSYLLPFS